MSGLLIEDSCKIMDQPCSQQYCDVKEETVHVSLLKPIEKKTENIASTHHCSEEFEENEDSIEQNDFDEENPFIHQCSGLLMDSRRLSTDSQVSCNTPIIVKLPDEFTRRRFSTRPDSPTVEELYDVGHFSREWLFRKSITGEDPNDAIKKHISDYALKFGEAYSLGLGEPKEDINDGRPKLKKLKSMKHLMQHPNIMRSWRKYCAFEPTRDPILVDPLITLAKRTMNLDPTMDSQTLLFGGNEDVETDELESEFEDDSSECTCVNLINQDSEDDISDIDCTYINRESYNDSRERTRLWRKRRLDSPKSCAFSSAKKMCSDSSISSHDDTASGSSSEKNWVCTNASGLPSPGPPELKQWLSRFNSWSGVERVQAIDALIYGCAADQVRHMMKAIEPLFQRDFISLLPKELALTVLGYLTPKDLLRAAQTCQYWRFLADDNLLWKEQCQRVGITKLMKRARGMPLCESPWKAAYMRQHIIENNWLTRPVTKTKILKGHDDHVITCLQFYGNRILSGSDDTTLKVWSAITGKCLRTLVGHSGGVWSSQMVGRLVISGSTDRTLRVWDAKTGDCLKVLAGHTSTVRCMHLHKDRVVSGSRDATLRIWSVPQGRCLRILVGHLAAVRCVQFDGKLVVSGAYDYFVKVWNPDTGDCLHTLAGHTNRVYSLQFDGVHVVSGSLDTSIRVWEVESGALKHTLMGHQSLTSGMELRSNILVSGNADSTVKVWDIITGHCLHTLSGPNKHQSAVTCLQSSKRFVITSSDDGTVKLWDLHTGEFIRNLVALDSGGSGGVVWRIRASSTKLVCAVGSRNGTEETKLMVLNFDVPGACDKCDV